MPINASSNVSFFDTMPSNSRRESGSTRLLPFHVENVRKYDYSLDSLTVDQLVSTDQVLDGYDRRKSSMGRAAGPDRLRLDEFHRSDIAANVRAIVELVKAETFTTTEPRLAQTPKPFGNGTRELHIFNVCERLVASSVNEILTQLISPHIHPMFHGYLPGLGTRTFHSDNFEHLTENMNEENIYSIELDIRKAFDEIQVEAVHKALLALGIPPKAVDTILTLSGAKRNAIGLPQGNALCPTLFTATVCQNLVGFGKGEHQKAHPMPFTYADNLCYSSKSELKLRELIEDHRKKLASIGLRWGTDNKLNNLKKGEPSSAMGTTVSIEGSDIRFKMSSKTLKKAKERYKASIAEANPTRAARERLISIVNQWGHVAATTRDDELRSILESITNVKGIEQPDLRVIVSAWRIAGNNWLQKHTIRHTVPNTSCD